MKSRLHIALVAPFSWSTPGAVNRHIADLALELRRLGHLPVVVTSSDDAGDLARVPELFRRARGRVISLLSEYRAGASVDGLLLPSPGPGPLRPGAGIPVVPLGASLPVRLSGGVVNLGLPVDVTSRLERLLVGGDFDLVHVHEPVAPSLSFTALREARSPVVGTFHLTPLGVSAYELGQPVVDRFFERLDARVVAYNHAREMMTDLYPGEYEVIPIGTPVGGDAGRTRRFRCGTGGCAGIDVAEHAEAGGGPFALYVYRGDARRSYRALLRALAAEFPGEVDRLVIAVHRGSLDRWLPKPTPRRLRDRVAMFEFEDPTELEHLYRGAAVAILPYLGGEWLCTSVAEAAVCGLPVVGPDLAPTRDLLRLLAEEGGRGEVFSPGSMGSLRAAIAQVLRRPADAAASEVAGAGETGQPMAPSEDGAHPATERGCTFTMASTAARVEALYRRTLAATSAREGVAGRTPVSGRSLHIRGIGDRTPRRKSRAMMSGVSRPDWINADLHVHSNYSKDCASTVESILETAREVGLGALAIADHNEIQGAFLARELSQDDPFIIVAEEVKTAEGEVIGLFLKEWVPEGLSFDETLSLIKEQGGLVYVPHPFDALRATPSYRALVDNLHRIDVIEVYNAKVALSSFNLAAERFAAKYNVVAGAGSDAHVLQSLGTAMLRMPRFKDQTGFMAALWEADIIARRKSLLYLQSLRLLQTTLDRVLPEQ